MAVQPQNTTTGPFHERVIADVRRFWTDLPLRIKVLMGVVVALIVVGVVAVLAFEKPNREVLFSGLTTEDASAIVEQLRAQKVDYSLSAGGGAIMVPTDKVHDLRLQLASEGLPTGGGVGFELFDEQRFGMTEFEERIALRRALEGELSRTIGRLDSVKNARIHLVLPKRSVLGANSTPAQSSVVVELQKGRVLSEGMVASVIHLVSSSVEGLSPDAVTVVDTRGRLLSSESGYGFNNREFEYKQKFEQGLELRLREMLDQTLGPNTSVVRVAADFDFSKRETTEERYDPERTALRSEQRELEVVGSDAQGAGGTPGVRSNLPGGNPPVTDRQGANKKRESETRNFEVDRVVNHVISPSATLDRISVTVLVDGKQNEGEKFLARSPVELESIELAVRGAIGYDQKRGDHVQIESVPFHVPEPIEAPTEEAQPWWMQWLPVGVGAGLVVVIALLLLLLMRRKKKGKDETDEFMGGEHLALPRKVEELEALLEKSEEGEGEPELGLPEPTAAETNMAMLMSQVRGVFMDESEAAARVIRSWLLEARRAEELVLAEQLKQQEKEGAQKEAS